MEQRPAPCCRVSSVLHRSSLHRRRRLPRDDDRHRRPSSSSSLSIRFDFPSFPPGFLPLFSCFRSLRRPVVYNVRMSASPFRYHLTSFISHGLVVGLLIKLYAGRFSLSSTKSRSRNILCCQRDNICSYNSLLTQ